MKEISIYQRHAYCPNCDALSVQAVDPTAKRFDLLSGYPVTVSIEDALAELNDASPEKKRELAERLVTEFCARSISEEDVHQYIQNGYSTRLQALMKCTECKEEFKVNISIDYSTECYSAFGLRLHHNIDAAVVELLGIHLEDLSRLAKGYGIGRDIVEQVYLADPARYADLYRLKQLYYGLPRDRGGGEIWTIVSGVVLSLLSSAIYDLAKSGGTHLVAVLRKCFSNRKIRSVVDEAMRRTDIASTLKTLNDEEIGAYFRHKSPKELSDRALGRLLRIAITSEAKGLRKELASAAKRKQTQRRRAI